MRKNLIILSGVMLLAVGYVVLLHRSVVREADPQIETAVRQEINSLSNSQESLRSLRVGSVTRTYVVGSEVSMTGYFEFTGVYSSQSCRIFITWRKADTNAPIDKIAIASTSKEPTMIWSRR